jgi:hypothetical protein
MKFLSIYRPDKEDVGRPPYQRAHGRNGQAHRGVDESRHTARDRRTPADLERRVRVRRSAGDITVMDGPFTEAKELIAGFALLEAKSKEEAIEMTRRFLKVAGDGETELHQIMEPGDFPKS